MARHRLFAGFVGLAACATLSGCASTNSVVAWQASVNRVVKDQGHGDPSVLRDVRVLQTGDSQRPALITVAKRATSSNRNDAVGVLVGQEESSGQTWYVFLVGEMFYPKERGELAYLEPQVKTVQIAALKVDGGRSTWLVGDPTEWNPTTTTTFPGGTAQYQSDLDGQTLVVTDKSSGKQWSLQLPG